MAHMAVWLSRGQLQPTHHGQQELDSPSPQSSSGSCCAWKHLAMEGRHITAYPQYQGNGQPAKLQRMKATRCLVSCVQHTLCTHMV